MYTVKEIFYTLQGEGRHTGRAAVFCRFSGCNLWSGLEQHRATAICRFCDTDFIGSGPDGGKFAEADALANRIAASWPLDAGGIPYVVCTGGEPLLQLDTALIDALHARGFEIAVETNGTLAAPVGIDWICVSPKAGATLEQVSGDEIKLVYPQPDLLPESVAHLEFSHFYLQPMDSPDGAHNTQAAIDYCLAHPRWKLSLQTHKITRIR
jgi:7-carboxy-7-deazaguanine synthase